MRWTAILGFGLVGCAVSAGTPEENVGQAEEALSSFACAASTATGYTSGKAFPIVVVTVDGKPVERDTANAYYFMAKAAAADGVTIAIVSGFRTMAQQQYLYNCYKTCSCNNCNLAAVPGYSNHQSGAALDLNTSSAGVYGWLTAHAASFGFHRTVPSEIWHWEYQGKRPVGGPCGVLDADIGAAWSNAKKDDSKKADYRACTGEKLKLWFRMKNTGTARWAALGSGAKYAGEQVALYAAGDKDALTGLSKIALGEAGNDDVLPIAWGGGAGGDCDDKPGCRRTVFSKSGIAAVAPSKPGVYTSDWRLHDTSPASKDKAFGPTVKLSLLVEDCQATDPGQDPTPPPDGPGSGANGGDENLPAFDDSRSASDDAPPEGEPEPSPQAHSSCAVARVSTDPAGVGLAWLVLAVLLARRRKDAKKKLALPQVSLRPRA